MYTSPLAMAGDEYMRPGVLTLPLPVAVPTGRRGPTLGFLVVAVGLVEHVHASVESADVDVRRQCRRGFRWILREDEIATAGSNPGGSRRAVRVAVRVISVEHAVSSSDIHDPSAVSTGGDESVNLWEPGGWAVQSGVQV